jgi:hypothetical protein
MVGRRIGHHPRRTKHDNDGELEGDAVDDNVDGDRGVERDGCLEDGEETAVAVGDDVHPPGRAPKVPRDVALDVGDRGPAADEVDAEARGWRSVAAAVADEEGADEDDSDVGCGDVGDAAAAVDGGNATAAVDEET